MDAPVTKRPLAWQPLTPRGIAAFGQARLGRLLLVQLAVAILAAAVVIWFLQSDWFPVVRAAIIQLPEGSRIAAGKLNWPLDQAQHLADNRFLSFAVDPKHEGSARSPAHIQVEFGAADIELRSLLGFVPIQYPAGRNFPFDRETLEPKWGAWSPEILAIVAGGVIAGLLASWAFLATLYWIPAWLLAFFANRDLSFRGTWLVAGAALMPGALFFIMIIIVYGLGGLDLIQLAIAATVHFVLGWTALSAAILALPLHPEIPPPKGNPFTPPPESKPQPSPGP